MTKIFKDNQREGDVQALLTKYPNHRVTFIQEHRGNVYSGSRYYSTYFVLLEANE